MSNNYKIIFNYLKTKKNINIDDLSTGILIFDYSNIISSKSIFQIENFYNQIIDFSENQKIEKTNLNFFKFNNVYFKFETIDLFIEKLIIEKKNILNNIKNLLNFKDNIYSNTLKYNEKNFLVNPFFLSKLENIKELNLNNIEKNKILDLVYYSKVLNFTLPCIGLINNKYSNTKNTICNFIKNIINTNEDNLIKNINYIPIIEFNINKTISNILLDIPLENKTIENIDNNSKKFIETLINQIKISDEEIFFTISKKNKKELNNIFLIPYKITKTKNISKKIKVEEIKKFDTNILKKSIQIIEHNNNLLISTLEIINNKFYSEFDIQDLIKILACYLYFIINLTTNIFDIYVDKLNDILKQLNKIRETRFKNLNIENGFKYVLLLKTSVLKFKYFLYNNFYNLFLPSDITDGNYGMTLNKINSYVPTNIFLNTDLNNIINLYPFENKNFVYTNIEKLIDFMLNNKSNYDVYKNNIILDTGAFIYDNKKSSFIFEKLKNNSSNTINNYKFNLLLINIVENYFNQKNIPIEFTNEIRRYIVNTKSININKKLNIKNSFIKNIIAQYKENIEKSYNNYIKIIEIRKIINLKNNSEFINFKKDEYLMKFNIYFMISKIIIYLVENEIENTDIKNKIIYECSLIKLEYEKKIQDKSEK